MRKTDRGEKCLKWRGRWVYETRKFCALRVGKNKKYIKGN